MTAVISMVLAVILAGPVAAQEFCSEPIAPSCLTTGMSMESTLQAKRCEEDLNRYEQNFAQFADCQTRKLDDMRAQIDEFRSTLNKRMEDAARAEGAPPRNDSKQNSGQNPESE